MKLGNGKKEKTKDYDNLKKLASKIPFIKNNNTQYLNIIKDQKKLSKI